MKFNDPYSQMFPGYPDALSLQQASEMLNLNRHTVGELIRSRRLFALSTADLRQFVRPGFDRTVQDAPVESLQPPALPGGAAPAQIGGGTT